MKNIADKEFWEKIHSRHLPGQATWKSVIKKLKKFLPLLDNYNDHMLFNLLLPCYLDSGAHLKCLEIGSAPGFNLVALHNRFKYEVYGVEYTRNGVLKNQELFSREGLPVENIIHADALSENFQNNFSNYFDVVCSFGFIEHFEDPVGIIEKHLNLLRRNGTLIISIPNFQGIYRIGQKILNKKVLDLHNLSIMKNKNFGRLFNESVLNKLYCDYYGLLTIGLFDPGDNRIKKIIIKGLSYVQKMFNFVIFHFFKNRVISNSFSPYILFIGKKK